MARMIFTVNCSLEQYQKILEKYGKGNISRCIMQVVQNDINGIEAELAGILPEMKEHIRLAVAAGKSKPEAETDFGRVFPDALWLEAIKARVEID